ncbi:MAG: nicotinate phosphoribosyltransferase, partial [Acholeplasmataceae bacterium]|nr:nicotinate phosphoribosyltransferase [Acholeplasmataceae bacterium]
VEPMLTTIYDNGKLVYKKPTLDEIRETKKDQLSRLWVEVRRLEYPHRYYVDLSKPLWDLKQKLIQEHSKIKK